MRPSVFESVSCLLLLLRLDWELSVFRSCSHSPVVAVIPRSERNLYAACEDYSQREKLDEIQIRTFRIGRLRWRSAFARSRFSNAARPLGTAPVLQRRERCSGVRSARVRPHETRVSARSLCRPPPLCTSRLWLPSGLSSVLILKEGFGPLFFLHERTSELRNQKRNAPNQRCRAEGNHDKRSFTAGLQMILFIIHAF